MTTDDMGGKGIAVCVEWKESFCAFKDWATNHGYDESKTIDRIDSTKGYSPHNCRFVSRLENCREGKVSTRLSMEQAKIIRSLYANGASVKCISTAFKVASSTIRSVINNYSWKEQND